jgi:hypothetical protein
LSYDFVFVSRIDVFGNNESLQTGKAAWRLRKLVAMNTTTDAPFGRMQYGGEVNASGVVSAILDVMHVGQDGGLEEATRA